MDALLLAVAALALLGLLTVWLLRANYRMRRSPSHSDLLFLHSPDPMLVVNQKGLIERANLAAHQILGYEADQLDNSELSRLVPNAARLHHDALVGLFFSSTGEQRMRNRIRICHADGHSIAAEIHLALITHEGRQLALAAIRDSSRLADEERKFRELERRYQSLFEQRAVGIAVVSLGGHFMQVNDSLCATLGYARETLMTLCFQDITHPDDLRQDVDELRALLEGEKDTYAIEKRYIRADGQIMWAQLTVNLVRNEQDKPDYFISNVVDISQRKWTTQLLQESEDKFRTIAETIRSVVWMATPGADRILYVNKAYERIWGRSRDILYENPQALMDAIVPEDRNAIHAAMSQHRQGEWELEYRIRNADGHIRYIQDIGHGVNGEDGQLKYLIGLATDVTEQVEARRAVEQALQREQEIGQTLQEQLRRDPLTGCLNRQALYEELDAQWGLYRRHQTPSTILFIDLNDFKNINDNYGHIAGDQALLLLADKLRSIIRASDSLARYAGDEFVVVLPQTTVPEAKSVVDKIRRQVLTFSTDDGCEVAVPFSIGMAYVGYPDVEGPTSWITVADQAMYLDKDRYRQAKGDK
ncbi:hypothetical protein GCM10011297_34820 [Bacterioplanes sanyensis]|uniref:PAS domain S-box protein n=1 Tax=Bacterioplanes sanyensis TaxID=1249553 RepID=UPI001672EC98|nr:PAS domain S-box protein [Bacterioplanes sanyensis]GGY59272.1 hypothetical protein GCM10011297_34820 [Bacterioplanes sanyensis]